jgi:hypothetical protein
VRRFFPLLLLASVVSLVAAGPGNRPRPLPVPPLTPASPPIGDIPEEVIRAAVEARFRPLAERMEVVSRPFLRRPYAIDPIGEGEGIDPDPPARYDAFDCLTVVEETLALALAGDPLHAGMIRQALRYGDAAPTYANRRHFMELQWIPGNIRDGWLTDTTRSYAETKRQEKDVTATTWKTWNKRSLFKLADEQLPTGHIALDVIPLDTAIAIADQLRPGSLVLTVRSNPRGPIWTSHLGFVVSPGVIRNASKRGHMRVVDERMVSYFAALKTYGSGVVAGITVLEPVEQDPRAGRVVAP